MIFFLGQVLQSALDDSRETSSELLFVMKAKISRRMLKLGQMPSIPSVDKILRATRERLNSTWDKLQNDKDPHYIWKLWEMSQSNVSFPEDTKLELKTFRSFLESHCARDLSFATQKTFQPEHLSRIRQCKRTLPGLNNLLSLGSHQNQVLLTDFEFWVDTCLSMWLKNNIQCSDTTTNLANLLKRYSESALQVYDGNPVLLSTMFLTTMELWVAMDKATITQHSLVADYDPGFPSTLLEPTLLPSKRQMIRLSLVENYMKSRDTPVNLGSRVHFLSSKYNSLPVRYCESSTNHMLLRQRIEIEAARKQEEKRDEFRRLKAEYRRLSNQFANMVCNQSTIWNGRYSDTSHVWRNCSKCQLERRMKDMQINVYEWPLPSDDVQAKLVVFELDVPEVVRQWRDATYHLQAEILAKNTTVAEAQLYWLRNYDGLCTHQEATMGRLQLGSHEKSFTVAHYQSVPVSTATEEDVLVNHGMKYDIRDSERKRTASRCIGDFNIRAACTFKLASGPYSQLQDTIANTTHTSNEIIARQSQCSPAINLHEFYAFGALRAGHRLQWINMARELTENVLSFNQYEVCALFLQASLQAGPAGISSSLRESHELLEQKHICLDLLTALEEGLSGVEANWQGAIATRLFTVLASRVLSLTGLEDVKEKSRLFLRRVRKSVLGWTRELQVKLHKSTEEGERTNLRSLCFEVALIGHLTFGANNEYVALLLTDQSDLSDAVEFMVSIRDNCPTVEKDVKAPLRQLLQESTVLCIRLEDRIRGLVLADGSGLDKVVRRIWGDYRCPWLGWAAVPAPNQHWLTTKTRSTPTQSSATVHLNILTGQLLVNGKPISRPPSRYESHDTFQRLFGAKILAVIPSTSDGMEFSVREQIEGHQVHFRMVQSELIIRATNAHDQEFELVPTYALEGDFPFAFIEDFHHWRNVATGVVEWRRLSSPWARELHPWELVPDGQDVYRLRQGSTALIEPESPTGRSLSSLLHPLERRTHLHAILDMHTKEVAVHLPRLNLDFDLDPDMSNLRSKQFRGLVVDRNQAIGTFIGLRSKLVLTTPSGTGGSTERCVIVPFGNVNFARSGHHADISIETGAARQVGYFTYDLDLNLRKLTGNTTLRGNLFKTYLHAVTAHCLPDKLTGRTGTEEALDCIRGASMRSFEHPSDDELELLNAIAGLTPRRAFYPPGKKLMQTVDWADLSPLSQHNGFVTEVKKILRHYAQLSFFRGDLDETVVKNMTDGEEFLLDRATLRDAVYRLDGFGAESYTTYHDVEYKARDRCFKREGELRSYNAARLACGWAVDLNCGFNIQSYLEGFCNTTINGVTGPSHPQDAMIQQLGYDQSWLEEGKVFLPDIWCALQYRLSSADQSKDKYRISFFLATLVFCGRNNENLVKTLLAFATVPRLRQMRSPIYNRFKLKEYGYAPRKADLVKIANQHKKGWGNSPESRLADLPNEASSVSWNRRNDQYERAVSSYAEKFADALMPQWRVPFGDNLPLLLQPGNNMATYIEIADAIRDVQTLFHECARNKELLDYVDKAQSTLNNLNQTVSVPDSYLFQTPAPRKPRRNGSIRYLDVFQAKAPTSKNPPKAGIFAQFLNIKVQAKVQDQMHRMEALLTGLRSKPKDGFEEEYAEDLQRSYESLEAFDALPELCGSKEDLDAAIQDHLKSCNERVGSIYNQICEAMRTGHSQMTTAHIWTDLAPRLSPLSLLQHLSNPKRKTLDNKWNGVLIQYGVALTDLQRAQRLDKLFQGYDENPGDLTKELANPGHKNWDPNTYPDWLLLELEGNLLIRSVQAQIAIAMIKSSSRLNSILQLNMGEGKSSVIVPIVAAFLADTTQKLARVVLLKPLAPQMLTTLISKCSGLLGRPIYYMPFSRSLQVSAERAVQIRELYQECMRVGGILLSQPEHLLSFELMGYESILSEQLQVGREMFKTQRWLHYHARDILDESDEILSVIFELIYTMGTQRQIEFTSARWTLIQSTLGRCSELAVKMLDIFPEGIEVEGKNGSGSFPHIRILQPAAGEYLLNDLACNICSNGLPTGLLKVRNLPLQTRDQLIKLITDLKVPKKDIESLLKMKDDSKIDESMWNTILVLRGMIACGALSFAFKEKRWRVHYGLDQNRSQLAVPFRAKDMPSARAEYSHPDSTIILTCLSYYYKGLSDEELTNAFDALFRCDNAQEEYEAWIRNVDDIPLAFQQVKGVNLQDVEMCSIKVFPRLRFAKGVIDFYLSHLVFPKEMREFPQKLSSSGWDIGQTRVHQTTGFSGTNDSRYILPLSIEQSDLPEQLHTNAMVMNYLLGEENKYQRIQARPGMAVNADVLLENVVHSIPPVRVILDVGAQVLDLENEGVGRRWLELTSGQQDAQAVVFFNNDDVLCVLDRNEALEPLNVSPFLRQMDRCLVYLDQAHTRGTDLKLPTKYRAAVTLGPLLTKDRLMQACMRMRNLGKGQSVVAFASKEIEKQIQVCSGKSTEDRIGMEDVLEWCIQNTCVQTRKEFPLWAQQGLRYQKQQCVLNESGTDPECSLSLEVAKMILEPEAQSLEERYGLDSSRSLNSIVTDSEKETMTYRKDQVNGIIQKCLKYNITSLTGAMLQEEQERELSPENEREQEIERPRRMEPCRHMIDPIIRNFVHNGVLSPSGMGRAYQDAFVSLRSTSAGEHPGIEEWPTNDLLVSSNFLKTVQIQEHQTADFYIRPVDWILSRTNARGEGAYLIISPAEANELLPSIMDYRQVTLHTYYPRIRLSMRSIEELSFCALPEFSPLPLLSQANPVPTLINLFAGQLYFRDWNEYERVRMFLGLCYETSHARSDGFVMPGDRSMVAHSLKDCRFAVSPIGFLRALTSIRRKGQSLERSRMGALLRGEGVSLKELVEE